MAVMINLNKMKIVSLVTLESLDISWIMHFIFYTCAPRQVHDIHFN